MLKQADVARRFRQESGREKVWKPAAVLSGAVGLIAAFGLAIAFAATGRPSAAIEGIPSTIPAFVPSLLLVTTIPFAGASILALAARIYALRRKK
jgi:ABC-type arginine transport system permease subunit